MGPQRLECSQIDEKNIELEESNNNVSKVNSMNNKSNVEMNNEQRLRNWQEVRE